MTVLRQLLATFRLQTSLINNAQYYGGWALDTSGPGKASFHIIPHADCYIRSPDLDHPTHLEQGDCVLFPRDCKHLLSNAGGLQCTPQSANGGKLRGETRQDGVGLICDYFHFKQNAASSLLNILPAAILIRHHEIKGNMATLMDLMINESLQASPGTEAVVDRLAEALFVIVLKEHVANNEETEGLTAALRDQRIHKALASMQARPHAKWTVLKLAEYGYHVALFFFRVF